MFDRMGTSCALSLLIVSASAVLLRPSDPPPAVQVSPPAPTPTVAWDDPPLDVVARPSSTETATPTANRQAPRQERGAFTTVAPGETLADVAARVYGDPEASERLWRANRDQVDSARAPLATGSLLRTP